MEMKARPWIKSTRSAHSDGVLRTSGHPEHPQTFCGHKRGKVVGLLSSDFILD